MNGSVSALLLSLLAVGTATAAEPVEFTGSIWEAGLVSLRFDEHIPPGQKRTMLLHDGRVVEMAVEAAGKSSIRLLGKSGEELHSVSFPVGSPGPRAFMYALCRKGPAVYSSPPDKRKPGCR